MPRKPPPPTSTSEEELVASTFLADLEAVAGRIAQAEGEPPGSHPMGDADKVKHWGLQDRRVDPTMLLSALLSTGLGQEAQQMTIVQERPELLDAYANPAPDPDTAQQLVALAQYPFRLGTVAHLEDDLDAWTSEAERLDRLWQQQQPTPSAATLDMTMAPPMVSPGPAPVSVPAAVPPPAAPSLSELGG